MDNLHFIQMHILKKLAFTNYAEFKEIKLKGISSDHISYHLRKLIQIGLITKSDSRYSLTNKGKLYVSHIDTDKDEIEKQPKSSVLIIPVREKSGKTEFLIHTRKKHPYFNYSGFPTGKIRYGETIGEAAKRELKEETGLVGDTEYRFTLHEMVYDKKGKQLEDKIFFIVKIFNIHGEMLSETQDGKNHFVDEGKYRKLDKLFHNELEILDWYLQEFNGFKEEKYFIEGF